MEKDMRLQTEVEQEALRQMLDKLRPLDLGARERVLHWAKRLSNYLGDSPCNRTLNYQGELRKRCQS